MHAAGCERDFWRLKRSRPLYSRGHITAFRNASNTTKKEKKKKKTHTGPKMEQDTKQKDTNTQKDTARGLAGLLPSSTCNPQHKRALAFSSSLCPLIERVPIGAPSSCLAVTMRACAHARSHAQFQQSVFQCRWPSRIAVCTLLHAIFT